MLLSLGQGEKGLTEGLSEETAGPDPLRLFGEWFEQANASGIVTFSKPAEDMAELQARLGQAGVTVSLRVMRDGSRLIRLSPHFYNTPAELDRLLEAL